MSERTATVERVTKETTVRVALKLDERAEPAVATGLGFLDHMISAWAFHSGVGLELTCEGDLWIDDHHSVEDSALCLGLALDEALGDRLGVRRFASAYAPLDEALARAVIDLSGRPHASIALGLERPEIGAVASENLVHFLQSFAIASRMTLHVDVLRGANDHHRAEAAFKALALASRDAIAVCGDRVRSTKGQLRDRDAGVAV